MNYADPLTRFWTRVGVICGGIAALLGLMAMLWAGIQTGVAFAWTHATRPIMEQVASERYARVQADSLIIQAVRDIKSDVETVAEALNEPVGSPRRARILRATKKR